MQYWLMKTEPEVFSIQDLAKAKKKTTHWDGVRNYQARNFMRDQMKVGDGVLIYHSNADPSCVVGTAVVSREAYPDFTAFDPNDPHYDPKSKVESPTWYMVDVTFESIFASPVSLAELRTVAALAKMELLRKGSRLSVQPVRPAEFARICKLGQSQE
jgi:predicted RNA-binding protein with PUA-like domain